MSSAESKTDLLPRVLVLLAAYNGENWIAEQIESVLAQEYVKVAIHVSDDCSEDGTRALLERFESRHDNVSITMRETPSGGAGANFRSMLAAVNLTGIDYVALCDQDDIWELDHLAEACSALSAKPSAGGYSCSVRTFGQARTHVLKQAAHPTRLDHVLEGAGQGCTFVFTAKLALKVRAVCREHASLAGALHFHDWLIYLVCRQSNLDWIFDERIFVNYRQHAGNEIGARSGAAAVQRRLSKIRDGWYAQQVETALKLALTLKPCDETLKRFQAIFRMPPSFLRRKRLSAYLLTDGRRKPADKVALFCFVMAGWL